MIELKHKLPPPPLPKKKKRLPLSTYATEVYSICVKPYLKATAQCFVISSRSMFAVSYIWVTKKPLKVVWLSPPQRCEPAAMRTYTLSPCCSCRNTAFPALSAESFFELWSLAMTIAKLFLYRLTRWGWFPPAWQKKVK